MAQARGHHNPVLVLGTSHLSSLPDDFPNASFDPLLEKLEEWAPEAIAIEGIAGPQCDYLREYDVDTFDTYCPDTDPARAALSITGAQATAEAKALLAKPGQDRSISERRHLVGLFLAMGEPESALVQWLRLPEANRTAGADLPGELLAYLDVYDRKQNENVIIGVRLAGRLGLDRVYRVDDEASGSSPADPEVYEKELRAIWDNAATQRRIAEYDAWNEELTAGSLSVLEWYRRLNSAVSLQLAMAGDFGAAAGADTPGNTGQSYLAYWETRNLRMVANIRQVIGANTRTLAIVGVSHKPYYDRYLGMMSNIALADTQAVLADD
ncbi:DUF5694 domain-containing protein [Alteriqipengyuania lutimaris]|uniref:Uncharacterized protein n=1 Tax=Alteriqipengyuania lutimaris TaxID=1538146 RepID=A0A395LL16_9SPHN|nr:DUF5694 domain-containing protein [Alteriqipengyuania lutimaris]MBB3033348.1 hypothetical protein [Alteriqipengyuania lutimaris]RDS77622.1 hypothetical protein DL238_08405 [Alteriqipengyuania lutimaris]